MVWHRHTEDRQEQRLQEDTMLSTSKAKAVMAELVELGLADDSDDACHQLVDSGDIDSTQHASLLSRSESQRVYGG